MNLPLFPLPIFLLPDGVTRLRIFEQRYLKMVRIATKENGFAILLNDANANLPEVRWASWVEIINFDQDEDGTLIIDVKCKSLLKVTKITVEKDQLRYGEVTAIAHWPLSEHDHVTHDLSESLAQVFKQSDDLRNLYQDKFTDQPNWVIARWLELLPVELNIKDIFIDSNSLEQAKQLIHTIIHAEQHH
ncbi:LON peptidase substrate-binding domain-containing protein [Colwellia asteriadis]|uniref:LON peptidase substrate-binding domain-containing protein n=1 Tax=Colwellia asteriadis TaxID=517723 RepID=A0ABP3WDS4_9GAMM